MRLVLVFTPMIVKCSIRKVQAVLTIPDICVSPNDIELNCEQDTDDVFLMGGIIIEKNFFILPYDCYSI